MLSILFPHEVMLEMEICIKMKLVFRILLLLTPFIGLGCSDSEPEFSEEDLPNRTILVYLAAENSLSSFALDDYDEMLLGMESVSEKNHLLVYVDVNKDKQGNAALPQLIHIGKNVRTGLVEETLVYEYPEQDASSVTVERMTDVFQRAFSTYPAKSYGLVLWSHGDGWLPVSKSLRSFGQDGGSSGPQMDILDLEEAVAKGTELLGKASGFDFIYFDACFMQGIEVAYQFRNYTNYIVACPLETPGPGSPYDLVLNPLFADTQADVVGMAEAYYNSYADLYAGGVGGSNDHWTSGAAISVVQTSGLTALADETRAIYQAHSDKIYSLTEADLADVQVYDPDRRYNGVYKQAYYDFGDLVEQLATEEEYSRWKQALDVTVPYKASTPTCYSVYYGGWGGNMPIYSFSGLSSYFPFQNDTKYTDWNTYYKGLAWAESLGMW